MLKIKNLSPQWHCHLKEGGDLLKLKAHSNLLEQVNEPKAPISFLHHFKLYRQQTSG